MYGVIFLKLRKGKFNNILREIKESFCPLTLICIAASVLLGFLSRCLSESPIYLIGLLRIRGSIPSMWLMTVIWVIFYALIGFSFGAAISKRCYGVSIHKYRGGMFFAIMMIFNVVWYPMFFSSHLFFLCLLDIALMIFFTVIAAIEFFKVNKISAFILVFYLPWLIYCLFLNWVVIMKI